MLNLKQCRLIGPVSYFSTQRVVYFPVTFVIHSIHSKLARSPTLTVTSERRVKAGGREKRTIDEIVMYLPAKYVAGHEKVNQVILRICIHM